MSRLLTPRRGGLTFVEMVVAVAIMGLVIAIAVPAVMQARNRARHVECLNRLKQLGLIEHSYLESHAAFPTSKEQFPGVFSGLRRLIPMMMADRGTLTCLADRRADEGEIDGPHSYYQNDGLRFRQFDRTGLNSDRETQPQPSLFHDTTAADISDGLSNTAAISEQLLASSNDCFLTESQLKADPVRYLWYTSQRYLDEQTLAANCETDRETPFPFVFTTSMIGRLGYDHLLPPNHAGCINGPVNPAFVQSNELANPASSQHGGYVNVLLADGAVRSIANRIDLRSWRALGTRAGADVTE